MVTSDRPERECESQCRRWTAHFENLKTKWAEPPGGLDDGRMCKTFGLPSVESAGKMRVFRRPGALTRARGSMDQTDEADELLGRHRAGDPSARDGLIRLAQSRFTTLARAMLRRYPHLRRWEQTDDLLNAALIRLHRSLAEVRPETVRHFDNLAATQIRRELIDLARSYYGPEGLGANHHTDGTDPGVRLAQVSRRLGSARDAGGVDGLP